MSRHALARKIGSIKPGQWFTIDKDRLQLLAPPMHLTGPLGPLWESAELVMENIIGSATTFRYWENPEGTQVTFEHLKQPLTDGRRTYVSPDRRDRFTKDSAGFYHPKTS